MFDLFFLAVFVIVIVNAVGSVMERNRRKAKEHPDFRKDTDDPRIVK